MEPIQCPKCGVAFNASEHRAHPGLLTELLTADSMASPEERIRSASVLRCPSCTHEFPSEAVRFFGVLSPTGMRYLVIAVLGAFLVGIAIVAVLRQY